MMALVMTLSLVPATVWASDISMGGNGSIGSGQDGNTSGGVYDDGSGSGIGIGGTGTGGGIYSGVGANSGAVAEVTDYNKETTAYSTIEEAFKAFKHEGTVKLLQDVTLNDTNDYGIILSGDGTISDAISGKLTLDLNGKTISQKTGITCWDNLKSVFYVGRGCTLTIQDSSVAGGGKILQPNGGIAVSCAEGGAVVVESGIIEQTGKIEGIDNCAIAGLSGTVTIKGGKFSGSQMGVGILSGCHLNVSPVTGAPTFYGGTCGLQIYSGGSATLSGGTYTGRSGILRKDGGKVTELLGSGYHYEDSEDNVITPDGNSVPSGTKVVETVGQVDYIGAGGNAANQIGCKDVTKETTALESGKWYVVRENVTVSSLTVSGTVNLILCDDATLTVEGAFAVPENATLNVYWQTKGTGKVTAKSISGTAKVSAPAGGMKPLDESSTTIEKCFAHVWEYTKGDGFHNKTCKLCKTQVREKCSITAWTLDESDSAYHVGTCVCGATPRGTHTYGTKPNDDGLTHTEKCIECGYMGETDNHVFDDLRSRGEGEETCWYYCCKGCSAVKVAEYGGTGYAVLQAAVNAAAKAESGRVELQDYLNESVTITEGDVTIDLKGYRWGKGSGSNAVLTVTGGRVTLENGIMHDSTAHVPLVIEGGEVTLEKMDIRGVNTGASKMPAVEVTSADAKLNLTIGVTLVNGMEVPAGKCLADYLPKGAAFEKCEVVGTKITPKGEFVSGVYDNNTSTDDMIVVAHEHAFGEGTKCSCGLSCDHSAGMDSATGRCRNCGTLMAEASVTAGSETTYYASFVDAVNVAKGQYGSTVTLLKDVTLAKDVNISIGEGTFTIDWKGCTLTGETWYDLLVITNGGGTKADVTLKDSSDNAGGARNHGGAAIGVYASGNVTIQSGIYSPQVQKTKSSTGKVTISGGVFENPLDSGRNGALYNANGELKDMLASGYTFAYDEKGSELLDVYNAHMSDSHKTVYVVAHKHECDEDDKCVCGFVCGHETVEDGKCTVCKQKMAASVEKNGKTTYYSTLEKALAAGSGGVVKLLRDAKSVTVSEKLTLDLNGKSVETLTVSGDVTLADLLPNGYAFKSSDEWVNDLDGETSLRDVTMARIPITNMGEYPKTMSMTYGGTGKIIVQGVKATGGTITYRLYKVENNSLTEVTVGVKKNTFDLAALKLEAGTYTFRFSATCDGYTQMSEDIVVTVKKATISSWYITEPTAKENLTYTGVEQALITEGNVTAGGTMQYSLSKNGTYSATVPTGKDAGTYTVWYKVAGDKNHQDTEPVSVKVGIGQETLTVTAENKRVTYGDEAPAYTAVYDGFVNGEGESVLTGTLSFACDYQKGSPVKVGGYAITPSGLSSTNYAIEYAAGTLTVDKATGELTVAEVAAKTYGDEPFTLTVDQKGSDGALAFASSNTKVVMVDGSGRVTIVGAGEATITVAMAAGTNHTAAGNAAVTITVNKAEAGYTAPVARTGLVYDKDAAQELVTAGRTSDGTMLYRLGETDTFGTAIPTAMDAGEYKVYYKVVGDSNHKDFEAVEPITVTIAQKKVTINTAPVCNLDKVYDGQKTTVVNDLPVMEGYDGALSYAWVKDDTVICDGTGAQYNGPSDAGSYCLHITASNTANYAGTTEKVTFTISARELTCVIEAGQGKVFGAAEPEYRYRFKNTVTGETPRITGLARETGETTADGIEFAGTYRFLTDGVTLADNYPFMASNYTLKFAGEASFTIAQAEPACDVPEEITAIYGQKLAEQELVNPEGNTPGTWSWQDGEQPVGDVAGSPRNFAVIFTPADTHNYKTVSGKEVSVAVEKAAYTADVIMSDYTFGTKVPAPTVSRNPEGGTVTYYYRAVNGRGGDAEWKDITPTTLSSGTYCMYAVIGETANYEGCTTAAVEFQVAQSGRGPMSYAAYLQRFPNGAGGTAEGNDTTVKSSDTGDAGMALYAVMAIAALGGMSLLGGKRKRED